MAPVDAAPRQPKASNINNKSPHRMGFSLRPIDEMGFRNGPIAFPTIT